MERLFGWKVILEIKKSKISVVKRKDDRILLSDNIIYSKLRDNSIYTHSYWDYLLPVGALQRKTDVLIVGLAGGTIAYQMNQLYGKNARIDAIEMNRDMLTASRAFLPKRLDANIILGDGVDYINKLRKKYNVIILDAFVKMEIPDAFLTEQFIDKAYNSLEPDGVLAINYISNQLLIKKERFKRRLRKRGFKVYTITEPRIFGNVIIICSKKLDKQQILKKLDQNFPKNNDNSFIIDGYMKMR